MPDRPPRRVVARPIAPPPAHAGDQVGRRRGRPRHPLLVPGLVAAGVAAVLAGAGLTAVAVRAALQPAVADRPPDDPAPKAVVPPKQPAPQPAPEPPGGVAEQLHDRLRATYAHFDELADARLDALLPPEVPPLPQDPAAAKRLRAASADDWQRATVAVFDRSPGAAAGWAAAARTALALGADERAARDLTGADDVAALRATAVALRAAVAAGCDDPLVGCWRLQQTPDPTDDPRVALAAETRAVERLLASPYPDPVRLRAVAALLHSIGRAGENAPAGAAAAWRQRFADLVGRVAAAPGRLAEGAVWQVTYRFAHDPSDLPLGDRLALLARATAAAPAARRDLLRGQWLIEAAWAARGTGPGKDVPADRHERFVELLRQAGAALASAAAADPAGWRAPAAMVTVCMGLGDPRATMEEWFARAMTANPDSADACHRKAHYLLPRWHGSREAADGFLWQCVRTGNTAGRLPDVARRVAEFEWPLFGPEYDKQRLPIQASYSSAPLGQAAKRGVEAQLRASPGDVYLRSVLARLLVFRGWAIAHEEFVALGAGYDPNVFPDPAEYEELRRPAERDWLNKGKR